MKKYICNKCTAHCSCQVINAGDVPRQCLYKCSDFVDWVLDTTVDENKKCGEQKITVDWYKEKAKIIATENRNKLIDSNKLHVTKLIIEKMSLHKENKLIQVKLLFENVDYFKEQGFTIYYIKFVDWCDTYYSEISWT